MTKSITILLSVFYLLISTGGFINVHYCNGQFNHIELLNNNKYCGCDHHADDEKNCCEDQSVYIQFDTEQYITKSLNNSCHANTVLSTIFNKNIFLAHYNKINFFITNNLSPPPKQPIWLRLSAFLFYG